MIGLRLSWITARINIRGSPVTCVFIVFESTVTRSYFIHLFTSPDRGPSETHRIMVQRDLGHLPMLQHETLSENRDAPNML